jgi:hypothetical protein
MKTFRFLTCIATGILLSAASARANVYATDIKVNGSLSTITNSGASPVTITYRLNQAATLGVTVALWQGTNKVATIGGGTNVGLNTVVWGVTNSSGTALTAGTFSVSITAATSGFTNWHQISVDTNAGNYAFDPNGIAVDQNTNSPYYGRVALGCSYQNGTATNPISGAIILDGIYKMNADGSFADEGGFGYGGYTMDDGGHLSTNQMSSASFVVPWRLRIGADDRIYMLDYSDEGAVVAFDMQVTTNQVVIDDGGADGGALGGPHNYAGNPNFSLLGYGIGNFDVSSTDTTNAAVWLCNNDYPNWGIWMYHITNGASVTNDNGTQAVIAGSTSDLSLVSSGGCTVDTNLDIFCGQTRNHENALYDAMVFTNWNGGILPPTNGGANGPFFYAFGTTPGEVGWGYGCGVDVTCGTDPGFEALQDVVINSRTSPTLVACPMGAGDLNGTVTYDTNISILSLTTNGSGVVTTNYSTNVTTSGSGGGIRVLDAIDGSVESITNGSYTESLTNIDWGQQYTCAAWDNVGNLYGASSTLNVWRVWSPPGTNTNTTVAVAQVIIGAPSSSLKITSISAVPTTSGCATITITFNGSTTLPVGTSYQLVGSSTLNGTYTPVTGAVMSGSSGAIQVTFTNCSTEFYEIKEISD